MKYTTKGEIMNRLSGSSELISTRLQTLIYELKQDEHIFLARVLDYENAVEKTANEKAVSAWHSPVTIEEFANESGHLTSEVAEKTWLESISGQTGLDCRMIVNYNPIKELGLYSLKVLVAEDGSPVAYEVKVWVVH